MFLVESNTFRGVVDLITMRKIDWGSSPCDGSTYSCVPLAPEEDADLFQRALDARVCLIDRLTDYDESLCELVLSDVDYRDIQPQHILRALRHATLYHRQVALMCGSSLKNRGIQPLLNNVINLLPNPTERYTQNSNENSTDKLCALAFKVVPNHRFGPLTFLRLYSGRLKSSSEVFNVNRQSDAVN